MDIAEVSSTVDAWCLRELERAAALLEAGGEARLAASLRRIGLLHHVRGFELGVQAMAGPRVESVLAPGVDDAKTAAVQSP